MFYACDSIIKLHVLLMLHWQYYQATGLINAALAVLSSLQVLLMLHWQYYQAYRSY